MKKLLALVFGLALLAATGSAQPVITQISNAASASLAPLPNSSIAQGSYFSIYGNGLAANLSTCGTLVSGSPCLWPPQYPLPTSIQGTTVSVTVGANEPVAAYVEFAAQVTSTFAQINAVLPSNTPVGTGTLTVSYNGQSASAPITVAPTSFGTFALNQAGSGPGIITDANYKAITPFHTAKPGEALILWGTGLGPVADVADEQSKPPAQVNMTAALDVQVWVGNLAAKVSYAGRSGYTAVDQIVFTVPTGNYEGVQSALGCYVNVAVQSGSPPVVSNFTTIAVDLNGGPCQDADGVDTNDLVTLVQSKGSAKIGAISLLSTYVNINLLATPLPWVNDTIAGEFATFSSTALDWSQGLMQTPSLNNCSVMPYQYYPPAVDPGAGLLTFLDAGPALSIQGPNGSGTGPKSANNQGYYGLVGGEAASDIKNPAGATKPFYLSSTANGDGTYTVTGITSGTYNVTGPGGSDVGPVAGSITVSPSAADFQWTNESAVTNSSGDPSGVTPIPRDQPLTITWSGGDAQGFINITVVGSTVQQTFPSTTTPGVIAQCVAQGNAGSFTIPAYVLETLPDTSDSGSPVGSWILVGPASAAEKINPAPSGLDAAYLFYKFVQGASAVFQ